MGLPVNHVQKIISESRRANRVELEDIFQRVVLNSHLDQRVIQYFTDKELKRVIVLSLYHLNCVQKKKNRYLVTQHLSTLTGYHAQSIVRLIKTKYEFNEDELDQP